MVLNQIANNPNYHTNLVLGNKRYELVNHVGSVNVVITDRKLGIDSNTDGIVDYYTADVVSYSDYYPFGMLMPERHGNESSYKYGFNGMLKDDEIKSESGTSYDFGARMYDPRVGRWLSIDPKASKYPMDTPYMAFGNSPISTIDGDGREKIVVVGSENRKWNLTFALPAMKKARELKKNAGEEQVTMLLFKAGYTDNQMSRIQKYVNKKGVKIQVVTSSNDVVNCVNNKSIATTQSGRKDDPITEMAIFAHGKPGEIMFGYHQTGENVEDNYRFNSDDVKNLKSSSFKSTATITSYACRTGAGKEVGDWTTDTDPENSLAQQLANQLGVTVMAYQCRTDYADILPSESILTNIGQYLDWVPEDKTFDKHGGAWDSDFGIDQISYPKAGTPILSPGMTTYKKGETPQVKF